MRSNSEVARSSRCRTIILTEAAIAGAASRRGKGNGARGSRRGRGAAIAPRGGRGAALVPRGRGAALAPRGRGAALDPRGGRGAAIAQRVRRLQFVNDEALEYDGVGDNDEDDGAGDYDEDDGAGDHDEEDDGARDHDEDDGEEHDVEGADEENEIEAQENADNEGENGEQPTMWLRGPAGLPDLPTTDNDKAVIEPVGDLHWKELEARAAKRRNPNGVVTVILKECFPGLVNYNGRVEPPWTWQHYVAAPDASDEHGVEYNNCLERMEETFSKYFRWATDPEDTDAEKTRKEHDARRVLRNVVKNKVIPSWAAPFDDCWIEIVRQRWCNDEWLENSNSCKERRSLMNGPAHRQGSSSFPRYKKIMEEKQKRPMSDLAAYVASRQGSENSVLCNDRAQQVMEKYTEVAKEKHGPDFDVMNAQLDPDVIYKAGCGKKHGRHFLANGYIDSRSLQGHLTQNQNLPVANNGMAAPPTPAGTPGTASSIGNNAIVNFDNP